MAFLFVLLSLLLVQPVLAQRQDLNVIAYYSGNAIEIDRYEVNKITHIIYSFILLKGNRLYVSPAAGAILKKLVSLRQVNPSLKVLIALGGWGGCKNCSRLFTNATDRAAFAASAKQVLDEYKLDGIDIDWEYPAIQGPVGHAFAPTDKQTFTALIRSLRDALGRKEISVAAGAFTEFLQQSFEWKKLAPLVDRFHLMSYDLVNRNSTYTGHHAGLYSTSFQKESTDNAVRYLDSLGIPAGKIVIGAAFYSRVYAEVDSTNDGLYQPGKFSKFVVSKAYPTTFAGFDCFWDNEAKAPYCYSASKRLFATFDDQRSVQAKTQYAMARRLNGIMFWELRQDVPRGGLLDAIYSLKTQTIRIDHGISASTPDRPFE